MKVRKLDGVVTATDTPGLHWLLGGLFVAVGALFVAGSLLATNAAEQPAGVRALAGLMGLAALATGLGVVRAAPRVVAEFDTVRGEVRVRRGRGAAESFPLEEVEAVELDESRDGDGDPVSRPALRLRGGRLVPLAGAWRPHGPRAAAGELAALLGVPGPVAAPTTPGTGN